MKSLVIAFFFLLLTFSNYGQKPTFGWSAGLSFSLGNKVQRIGLRGSAFYTHGFAQVNATTNVFYNFKSIATGLKTPEFQFGIGGNFGFGRRDSSLNHFVSLTDNNTDYFYSVGYSYLMYLDKIKTSQAGGILSVNIDNFTFATHNDLFGFGKGWRDRFRTAALLLQYRYLDTKAGINMTFWTGDYIGCEVVNDGKYPSRFGYKKNDKAIYGRSMASLLSLQIEQFLSYNQIARLNIGMDSEKVRHAIQNRLIHDQYYVNRKFIKRPQKHYPMLDKEGGQYTFKHGESVRPASLYFNLGLNSGVFY
jgi:hypothetical protein